MAFSFTCPSCKKQNYGKTDKPEGLNYFEKLRCQRCGKTGIYWVDSAETAILLREQLKASPDDIAVGVHSSTINYIEPISPGASQEKAAEVLKPFATLAAPFSQGERFTAFTPESSSVKEGQCEGQCLHWIRRVLQNGQGTYQVREVKDGTMRTDAMLVSHQKNQSIAGAATQIMLEAQRKKTTIDPEIIRLQQTIAEKRKVATAILDGKLEKAGFTKAGQGKWSVPQDLTQLWESLQKERLESLQKFDETSSSLIESAMRERGFYSHAWDNLARDLDQKFASIGFNSGKPYSNIVAIKSANRSPYDSAELFFRRIFADAEFRQGTAVLISAGLKIGVGESGGRISGHAITVHYKTDGVCYLFDPNISVFCSATVGNVEKAANLLVGKVWTEQLEWQLDGAFGYAYFRVKGGGVANEKDVKSVVLMPCPISTGLENRVTGVVPVATKPPAPKTETEPTHKSRPLSPGVTTPNKPLPKTPVTIGSNASPETMSFQQKRQMFQGH